VKYKHKLRPTLMLGAASGIALAGATALPDMSYAAASMSLVTEYAGNGAVGTTDYYIVRLSEPALASYRGGVAGLRTPPRISGKGSNKLDPHAPESIAYVQYLEGKQQAFLQAVRTQLGRDVEVLYTYQHALNGMAIRINAEEAAQLAQFPGVASVTQGREYRLNSDSGPTWIGAPKIWGCHPTSGSADTIFKNGFDDDSTGAGGIDCTVDNSDGLPHTKGEGIIIGVIDGGVNFNSPSFAATGGDGYTHTNPLGAGTYLGSCAPGKPDAGKCNDKLIGAWGFVGGTPASPASAVDTYGHGSHTASTAGGNYTTINYEGAHVNISGVAPHANLIIYKGCAGQTCGSASLMASINQVIADGKADVVNYSISGGSSPWDDPMSLGFRSATDAGILVAAAAGNTSDAVPTPVPGSANHLEPWTIGVANLSHDRLIGDAHVDVAGLGVKNGVLGNGPEFTAPISGPLVKSNNLRACTAQGGFTGAPSTPGFIAVIERGDCEFTMKINNAKAAGAAAVVVFQNVGAAPIIMGQSSTLPPTAIPALMVSQADGQAIVSAIGSTPGLTGTADKSVPPLFTHDPSFADIQSESSLWGPAPFDVIKPEIGAPGTNILAAINGDATSYGVMSGTSMATPHITGSAALLKSLHPDWSPMEIKSALMLTAKQGVRKAVSLAPADPFDTGAGRVDLNRAAATPLVLDETVANMTAADPDSGGEPRDLNLPSLQDGSCSGTCTFTRTVKSVAATAQSYTAAFTGASGLNVTVSPSTFSLAPGATQVLTFNVDVSSAPANAWIFGRVTLTPSGGEALGMPVAIKPQAAPTTPTIAVSPAALGSTQAPDTTQTKTLTVSNAGGGTLTWSFATTGTGPIWDQPKGGDNGIVSDFSASANKGAYTAADFQVTAASAIRKIKAYGFDNSGTLTSQSKITWRIYGDAGGKPDGNPDTNTGTPVWSFETAPNGAGVTIGTGGTGQDIALDLTAAGQNLNLQPGTYWLTVYPTYSGSITGQTDPRWNWFQAGAQKGNPDMLVSSLFSTPNWTTLQSLVQWPDVAFTIEGDVTCGAPWLTLAPTSGSSTAGGSTQVTATFNSNGLAQGTYNATACLASNDAARPMVTVPVTLTVQAGGGTCTPTQLFQDPSFEIGAGSNGAWTSVDSLAGTSYCDESCDASGTIVAHNGDWFVWFGGFDEANTSSLSQSVVFPSGQQRWLNYWMIDQIAGDSSASLKLSIDGTNVLTVTPGTPTETYAPKSFQIPAQYLDGQSHEVKFSWSASATTGQIGGAMIDDVTLDCAAQPTSSSSGSPVPSLPILRKPLR
jgi:subtilisin family serine protease